MKAVKLLKNYGSVFTGEVAGFPDAEADALIEQGLAETYPKLSVGPGEEGEKTESLPLLESQPSVHPLTRKRKR